MVCAGFLGFLSNAGFWMKLGSQIFQNMRLFRIERDIRKPQNLAGAAVKFLSFTVVFRNYVFADIGIIGDYTSLLVYSMQQTTAINYSFVH